MKTDNLSANLLRRCAAARNPLVRWFLHLHVQRQRLRARWFATASPLTKRALDIVGSAFLLVMAAPVLGLLALLIKLEDGGPVFFKQARVGQDGKEFTMYKVRSMCLNAEQKLAELLAKNHHAEGVTFKLEKDPRITRVGKWLRKLSLDELPQLYNVFKGDMSLVGPRPPLPREVAKYTPADRRRLAVKPGITCIWQISGRAQIDFSGQVHLDVRYIENQSFWDDLVILTRTVPAVISGRGAC
jgi:exopolysaccharide biosynthesis polyprenyl glycosylphosphotransferase